MNQHKLYVFKQEMARLNIGILIISELNWKAMRDLIQMTIIYTTVGRNPLGKSGVTLTLMQRNWNVVLEWNLKNGKNNFSPYPMQIFKFTVIQFYVPTSNAEKAEVDQVYEHPQGLLELLKKVNNNNKK